MKIIKNSPTKSCLLDPVPTFLLKDCVDILLPSITKLINLSLVDGVLPQQFKKAVVTSHIKKASLPNEDLKNYRPVSGLCFMSKLVEQVVVKQLMQRINSNNLDNLLQSAYKTGHSTETALLHIKNEIHTSLSRVRPTALVLTDAAAVLAANDLVSSRLDYCNSLFRSLSSFYMHKLQCIKNTLGRIVANCNIDTHGLVLFSKNSIGCQLNFS